MNFGCGTRPQGHETVNRLRTIALILVVAGCAAVAVRNADELYGPEMVRDRVAAANSPSDYQHDGRADLQPALSRLPRLL